MNDEVPWIEATTIGPEAARETWALAARHVLADAAMDYHSVIPAPDLARAVQERSRIRTRAKVGTWLGDVLYRVAADCVRRREPLLSSLCVSTEGRMGDWYADTVLHLRGEQVADPEQHAAQERLECYRLHGAELPPDGGSPALPPQPQRPARVRAARSSTRPAARRTPPTTSAVRPRRPEPVAPKICDRCFTELPASGQCDYCD